MATRLVARADTVMVAMEGAAVEALVGLAAGDLLGPAGGLLLCGGRAPSALDGLRSKWTGFSGVLPNSAYFQNGAGELVGMC